MEPLISTRLARALRLGPMLLLLGGLSGLAQGQQLPILESLGEQQVVERMQAAPDGDDEPLEQPVIPTTLPVESPLQQPIPEEPASAIEERAAEKLDEVSLEEKIQKQILQSELKQFGYDLFDQTPTTFAPVTDLPVPSDYVIGPGDTLVVQVYGKLNVEYSLVVTRDGRLLVPELGPIQVGGLRFDEVRDLLRARFEQQIVGAKAVTTMGALRTIQVLVVGEVVKPGNYSVSGLSTLLNTLITSGGVKRTGTLRRIELKRDGQVSATLDLYDVLLGGDTSGDVQLQHRDVIFVPPIGPTVGVAGEVQRPAIYELRRPRRVEELLELAGGLLPTASLADAQIERIQDGDRYTLVDAPLDEASGRATQTRPGDTLRIFPVTPSMDGVVLLSGHVLRPGGFQHRPGMRVSSLLTSPRILRPNADVSYGLLRRESPETRRIQIGYLDIASILRRTGGRADLVLQPRDEVIVFDLAVPRSQRVANLVRDLRTQAEPGRYPPMVVDVRGQVRATGTFPLAAEARLLDVIGFAGGVLEEADRRYGLVARKHYTGGRLQFLSFSLDRARAAPHGSENLLIYPEDTIYVFDRQSERSAIIADDMDLLVQQTPYGEASPVIYVRGEVRHPGRYPLEPGMRVADLLRAAGGLSEEAYGLSAELTSFELLQGEYRAVQHRQIDLAEVALDDESGRILEPHDELVLHRKPNWLGRASVTLAGEIRFPGDYPITRGETLCQVIKRAGGLTEGAYPFGAVFIRERVRKQQQQALDRIQNNLDDLLVNLSLSFGVRNDEKTPAGERKQELIKVIKQLKQQEAIGRMVIDLDRAMACSDEANIQLQDGDKLTVTGMQEEVTVVGEVYHPSSHLYRKGLSSADYVDLSGGTTVLARRDHVFVMQANGEIVSVRGGDWTHRAGRVSVTPGATIYVPLNVDRMNKLEAAQSWTQILYHLGITAASLNTVGLFD
ncbi:SLBB domain-containing protein [Marichromatium sp. PS1]|uniref:SLBB domain-containing protein n=1 Tax=Marichromatium sp. PS1 TaxID=3138932 RepID=UPI0032E7D174